MNSNLRPGYVSILAVVTLSSILLVMLTASFRFAIQNQETQKKTQVRIDYANRETALLRAVLSEAPNQAMRAMMADSSGGSWNNKARWRWIFQYARDKADGETAIDPDTITVLGISSTVVSGNTGDGTQDHIKYSVNPVEIQAYDHWFYLNAGVNSIGNLLGSKYPEALDLSGGTTAEKLDRDTPIITMNKAYSNGEQFKLLPYPKTSFGYMVQGQNFVAKRNWWAFRMTYGAQSEGATGVKTVDKDYVLSIYEVPSQLGLGSTVDTILGKHADGTNWNGINIDRVYGSKVATEGTVAFDSLATRRGATISSNTLVGGVGHNAFTGALPDREEYTATNNAYFPISSSADSGLVSFIPISRGEEAFDDLEDTSDSGSISPTGWNYYSRPAMQCVMKLRVEDVISVTDQTPTSISFTYRLGGIDTTETFTRGNNWPTENSAEGATFPFHLETSNVGRPAIAVYVDRMIAHLQAAGADSLDINHSLIVNSNYPANALVQKPNIPSQSTDLSLILRDSKDFSAFPKGFSLVSPYRLYLANDVNVVSNGGVDANGNPTFPPISLFAPEKRFGVRDEAIHIDFEGQINQIGDEGSTGTARPLDLRSGIDDEVISNNISADLYSITTPDQIPPINQMNWLVVIERVN